MDFWSQVQITDPMHVGFWSNTLFSDQLIKTNASLALQGFSLRLTYPKQGSKDPLNIAEYPVGDQQLGTVLIADYVSRGGKQYSNKESNWATLVHILLDNTVCYLEVPSAKFRTKAICTRNLYLANALSSTPIKNFDLLYAILSNNVAYIDALLAANPALSEALNHAKSIAQELAAYRTSKTAPSKDTFIWLAEAFNSDKTLIKAYADAYNMVSKGYEEGCLEVKCGFLKLKPNNDGVHLEMPTRVTGTLYDIPKSSILVPLSFMRIQAAVIRDALSKGIVATRFKRDNDVIRDMVSSSNPAVLDAIYHDPAITASNCHSVWCESRGYIQAVDICNSCIGGDLLRAISLARIIGIEFIQPDFNNLPAQLQRFGFHPSLATANLAVVLEEFKTAIGKYAGNLAFINMIWQKLNPAFESYPPIVNAAQGIQTLIDYVDLQNTLTSSFARTLHIFMVENPVLFPGYSGQPTDLSNVSISSQPKFKTLGVAN